MNTQNQNKSKREKTVHDASALIHLWANQKAPDYYRSKSRNVSISNEGKSIKHWATVLATLIEHKGKKAFVVDLGRFSVTTSAIQSEIRGAIRGVETTFYVECGRFGQYLDFTPKTLRDYYLTEFNQTGEKSKYGFVNAARFLARAGKLKQAIAVSRHFGLGVAKLETKLAKLQPEIDSATAIRAELDAKLKLASDKRDETARLRREREEQAQIARAIETATGDLSALETKDIFSACGSFWNKDLCYLENRPDLQAKVRAEIARREALTIQDWLNGVPYAKCPEGLTLLRVVESEGGELDPAKRGGLHVQTSKGARFPLADAERAFRFVLARRFKGWHRNGETFEIGDYQLDAVNENGVVAGCHRLGWDEIERFAKAQGWV